MGEAGSKNTEMIQRGEDTQFIHPTGGIVGLRFDKVTGAAHGYADAGKAEHRQIVFPVAEGHDLIPGDAQMIHDGLHTGVLAAGGRDDVQEHVAPAGVIEPGSQFKEFVLLLRGEEGDDLIDGDLKGPGQRLDGGRGQRR